MKTIFYFIAFFAASFFISAHASAQYGRPYNEPYYQQQNQCGNEGRQSFYYYPQSNVYYNCVTNQYIYFDCNSWVVSDCLPHHIRLDREPYFVVNHNGSDVWNDNRFHVEKFRNYNYQQPDMAYEQHDKYRDYRRHDDWHHDDWRDNDWRR